MLSSSTKVKPKVLVLSGHGLNCEEETLRAFELAGGLGEIIYVNDLVEGHESMDDYQILAIPGGFSYGDHTGSGKAYANLIKNHLHDQIFDFAQKDKLIIGICNGFQVLTNIGLVPGLLTHNKQAQYIDRWVDLEVVSDSPWLKGISSLCLPIAHGEGRFYSESNELEQIKSANQIAFQYRAGEFSKSHDLEANPNGSIENIASVSAYDGRVIGMMPHPERAVEFNHLPNWTLIKEKLSRTLELDSFESSLIIDLEEACSLGSCDYSKLKANGLKIFRNAVNYFQN